LREMVGGEIAALMLCILLPMLMAMLAIVEAR
jgi:hypothetical protein